MSVPEGGPDEAVLAQVRELVLPQIERRGPIEAWIIDDTGFPKKGVHSGGVARQYCGQLGKHFVDAAEQELPEPSCLLICPNTGSTICLRNR